MKKITFSLFSQNLLWVDECDKHKFTNPMCTNIFASVAWQNFGLSVVRKLTDLVYTSA